MDNQLKFQSRDEFRDWLQLNCNQSESVWLIFEKGKDSTTLSAQDALEEALCFGWIDGQLGKRNDSTNPAYIKKFSPRRKKSKWSERNKKLTEKLIHSGLMTEFGLKAIENAKRDGTWEGSMTKDNSTDPILLLETALEGVPEILDKFKDFPPSGRKTLSYYYADAKKEETKKKRLNLIIEAIKCNKKSIM